MALTTVRPQGMGFVTGRRNLIINGAMQVAQRGTGETGRSSNGYYASDRFQMAIGSLGTWDISQETDSPEGFSNSFKVEAATAVSSPSASGLVMVIQQFEGQNLQHLKKGTANALPITLSFWVKSNVTGTYQVNIRDQDNVRYISATYSVNASGTWEYKTITFAGDTTGVLDNDNAESMRVEWWLASGSNFTSGALNTNWAAANNINRNAGSNVNLASAVGNDWLITGVQLEVGSNASDFEHRSFGEELTLCQRYYYRIGDAEASSNAQFALHGRTLSSNRTDGTLMLPVPMRAVPSVSVYESSSTSVYPSNASVVTLSGETYSIVGNDSAATDIQHVNVRTTGGGTFTNGHGATQRYTGNISLDAEL